MQRNVTKCIGVAGKAAPCGGAGPSRVQGLRGTPDAACNQEKEKASGRWFAKHRPLAFWAFRFRHPILPMRFSRYRDLSCATASALGAPGSFMIAPMTAAMIR